MEKIFLKSFLYYFGILFVLLMTIDNKTYLGIAIVILTILWFVVDYIKLSKSKDKDEML